MTNGGRGPEVALARSGLAPSPRDRASLFLHGSQKFIRVAPNPADSRTLLVIRDRFVNAVGNLVNGELPAVGVP